MAANSRNLSTLFLYLIQISALTKWVEASQKLDYESIGYAVLNTTSLNTTSSIICAEVRCVLDKSHTYNQKCKDALFFAIENTPGAFRADLNTPVADECETYLLEHYNDLKSILLSFCGLPGSDNTLGQFKFYRNDTAFEELIEEAQKSNPAWNKIICDPTQPNPGLLIGIIVSIVVVAAAAFCYNKYRLKQRRMAELDGGTTVSSSATSAPSGAFGVTPRRGGDDKRRVVQTSAYGRLDDGDHLSIEMGRVGGGQQTEQKRMSDDEQYGGPLGITLSHGGD